MPKQNKKKKGMKGKDKKKGGRKSAAVNYVTRSQALRKLQVSLASFRRLCILKGVYPRDPGGKHFRGKGAVYHLKDIRALESDPILSTLREARAHKRKVKKAEAKKEYKTAEKLKKSMPRYTLHHVLRERYPSFVDAIRDLDDALCMISLFANHPNTKKISSEQIQHCAELSREFQAYVVRTGALTKAFLSIKGIYYQAVIMGQPVTWLVPYKFTQKEARDVDYNVMLTFLELSESLLGFVLWKLYNSLSLQYPPPRDAAAEKRGEMLGALVMQAIAAVDGKQSSKKEESASTSKAVSSSDASDSKRERAAKQKLAEIDLSKLERREEDEDEDENEDEDEEEDDDDDDEDDNIDESSSSSPSSSSSAPARGDNTDETNRSDIREFAALAQDDATRQEILTQSGRAPLFEGLRFFLSREVPHEPCEFVIRSLGGLVVWAGTTDLTEDDPSITHQVVDRDDVSRKHLNREYIQPQWLFDCLNAGILLPCSEYAPDATLPPHLSPFVDDEDEGYIPTYRAKINSLVERAKARGDIKVTVEDVAAANAAAAAVVEQSRRNADLADSSSDEQQSANDSNDDESRERKYQDEFEEEERFLAGSGEEPNEDSSKRETQQHSGSSRKRQEREEEEQLPEIMIPRKQRRLLSRIKFSKKKKESAVRELEKKRKKTEGKRKKK